MLGVYGGRGIASPLYSKVALADSVEDPLEASPLCSKVALADSSEDPLARKMLLVFLQKKHFGSNFHPAPVGSHFVRPRELETLPRAFGMIRANDINLRSQYEAV